MKVSAWLSLATWPRAAVAYAGIAALLVVLVAGYNHEQRAIGRAEQQLAESRARMAGLERARDSIAAAFRPETLRFTHWRTVYDSGRIRSLEQLLDSLRAAGVPAPDTVKVPVPVRVLVAADSGLAACTELVPTCAESQAADARIEGELRRQLAASEALRPSGVRVLAGRVFWAAVGAGLDRLVHR